MFRLRASAVRAGDRLLTDSSLSLALTLALMVAGCGGRQDHAPTADARVAAPPASQVQVVLTEHKVEMEDDGLPAQTPPLMRTMRIPDDPTEPFSRNYGGAQVPLIRAKSTPSLVGNERRADANIQTLLGRTLYTPAEPAPAAESGVRISARDLPADLPPDFRERLIVANGLR